MDGAPNEYDVGETITLKSLFLAGPTVGSIVKGQTLLHVRDASELDLANDAPILVVGAGEVDGDLATTVVSVSEGGQAIVLTDAARTSVSLGIVGTPTGATVTCKIAKPDGSEETATVTNPSLGRYRATFTPELDGEHFYVFEGAGLGTGRRWRKFVVRPNRVP